MHRDTLGERLAEHVSRIVGSYKTDERTHHIDGRFLPSRERIVRICDLLLELTYPGGYGRRDLTSHNIAYHVGELTSRLYELLRDEVAHCLLHELERVGKLDSDAGESQRRAAKLAEDFLRAIPEIRGLLALDVQAHYDGDPAAQSTTEIVLSYPGMLAVSIHRYAHALYKADVPKLPRIMAEHAHRLTGIDVHPGATIGKSFCIDHGTGVVIGETSHIGDNVKIYQGVTLGALSFPKDERGRVIRGRKRHPTIGNNVTIYANAIILGGETVVGDGAVIGGSVFVTQSVAPGYQVAITPPVLKVRPPRGASDYVPDWAI